jgi:hypothetical protein
MATISTSYDLKFQYKPSVNYKFTDKGICINTKRNRIVKRTLVGYTEGFCLNGKFKSLMAIRKELELIPKSNCPF